jgi:hypothetical protein
MAIKLAIAGRPPIELFEDTIVLGSDPGCTVTFEDMPNVKPEHAVIRMIAGRWLVEAREADAILIGDNEPKKVHWLNPGDLIRMSESGPTVIFQPLSGESPAAGSRPQAAAAAPKPASVRPPSSNSIRVPKALSSSTIPTSKPPSSATMRTARPASGQSAATGPGAAKPGRSDASIPASGQKRARSSAQMPVYKPISDQGEANLPTLQRISSWDQPSTVRRTQSEQAEIRWIMMVVGRSVGAGLIILILWIAISSVWRSISQPQPAAPPALSQAAEEVSISPLSV